MINVLVLDAEQRSALAITRSLGQRGIKVITADTNTATLAGSSKYSAQSEAYPEQSNESDFLQALQSIIKKHDIALLIPVAEVSLYTVLKNISYFNNVIVPYPSLDKINTLSDKAGLIRLCQALDVPSPQSVEVMGFKGFKLDELRLSFPVVLKPYKSKIEVDGKWLNTGVKYARSAAELDEIGNNEPAFRDHKFLIQEYIEGAGAGVFLLYDHGQCIAEFSHERIREKPPSGGVSVLCKSVPMRKDMLETSKRLLDHLNWHGPAMVEFKISPAGKPYIMEVNTRFWGSLQLAIDAGVDFPFLLYSASVNPGSVKPINNYKSGVRLRWLLGDIDRLYLVLKSKEYNRRKKVREILTFLVFLAPNLRYEVNRLSDIRPFYFEAKRYIRDFLKSSS